MLGKLGKIKEIAHPDRRGFLGMIGGAILNPNIGIAGNNQISETVGRYIVTSSATLGVEIWE